MRFIIHTVVDITETNARRGQADKLSLDQQANYNTLIQTIGLRVNADPIELSESIKDVGKLTFGDAIKGKQRVWTFEFDNPFEGALSEDSLNDDFDLVPVITNLNETVNIHNSIFCTKNPNDRNIIFQQIDK
jgi:hypothetical protein